MLNCGMFLTFDRIQKSFSTESSLNHIASGNYPVHPSSGGGSRGQSRETSPTKRGSSRKGSPRKSMRSPTPQVWPLTQLYSVDFSKSRIDVKKKCVFNKRTVKVCVSCF